MPAINLASLDRRGSSCSSAVAAEKALIAVVVILVFLLLVLLWMYHVSRRDVSTALAEQARLSKNLKRVQETLKDNVVTAQRRASERNGVIKDLALELQRLEGVLFSKNCQERTNTGGGGSGSKTSGSTLTSDPRDLVKSAWSNSTADTSFVPDSPQISETARQAIGVFLSPSPSPQPRPVQEPSPDAAEQAFQTERRRPGDKPKTHRRPKTSKTSSPKRRHQKEEEPVEHLGMAKQVSLTKPKLKPKCSSRVRELIDEDSQGCVSTNGVWSNLRDSQTGELVFEAKPRSAYNRPPRRVVEPVAMPDVARRGYYPADWDF